jgi:hypothetical protein
MLTAQQQERFERIVREALEKAEKAPKDSRRWTNAINKAFEFMQDNPLWHLVDGEGDVLLLLSPQSNEVYEVADDSCERIGLADDERHYCPCFEKGKFPCWHRAFRRLVLLLIDGE